MRLLLQLDGTLPDRFPDHQRRVYIFSCVRRGCKRKEGCVRAIRGVKLEKKLPQNSNAQESMETETREDQKGMEKAKNKSQSERDIGRELFGTGSTSTSAAAPSNPFASPSQQNKQQSAPPKSNPFASLDPPSSLAAKPPQKASSAETTQLPTSFAAKVSLNLPSPATATQPSQPQRSSPSEPWLPTDSLPKPYPKYNLDAEYESLESPQTSKTQSSKKFTIEPAEQEEEESTTGSSSRKASRNTEGGGGGGGKEDKETFESALDRTFQRFADRVSQNPEQVLRYEFAGIPLLYSMEDEVGKRLAPYIHSQQLQQGVGGLVRQRTAMGSVGGGEKGERGIPRCEHCRGERVFEVQLMPHCITELEKDFDEHDDDGCDGQQGQSPADVKQEKDEGKRKDTKSTRNGNGDGKSSGNAAGGIISSILEWGTVIVGVCSRDCIPPLASTHSRGPIAGGGGDDGGGGARNEDEEDEIIGYVEEWVGVQWE